MTATNMCSNFGGFRIVPPMMIIGKKCKNHQLIDTLELACSVLHHLALFTIISCFIGS